MKRTLALLSLGGLLLFPATPALAAGEPIVAAVIDLGQAGNAGNGFRSSTAASP